MSQAIRILRLDVLENELDALFKRFAVSDRGALAIDYDGFLSLLGFKRVRQGTTAKEETDALIATIRRRIEETVGPEAATSAARVKEVFSDIDRDNSGSIDKTELEKALKVLRITTTPKEVDMLFDRFDDSRRGVLDYHNYLELLGFRRAAESARRSSPAMRSPAISPRSKDHIDALVARIRLRLEDSLGSEAQSTVRVKEAFSEIDRDGSGTIDRKELGQAMRVLKVGGLSNPYLGPYLVLI